MFQTVGPVVVVSHATTSSWESGWGAREGGGGEDAVNGLTAMQYRTKIILWQQLWRSRQQTITNGRAEQRATSDERQAVILRRATRR